MQPTLTIIASVPGVVMLNGRFAGEVSAEMPLLIPVQPYGPTYLDYHPLVPGWMPMARKLVFSGGMPLEDSLSRAEDVYALIWPGGVTELELSPAATGGDVEEGSLDGIAYKMTRAETCTLEMGAVRCNLPANAQTPNLNRQNGCVCLFGRAGDMQYLLTLSEDLSRQTGELVADRIDFEAPQILRTQTDRRDIAGRATVERWQMDAAGLHPLSAQTIWIDGTPRIPATPEEAALSAVESALLGEANAFLPVELQQQLSPEAEDRLAEVALPMKYAPPNGRPCIALVCPRSSNSAVVLPLYYQVAFDGGQWKILHAELGDFPGGMPH